MRFFDGIMRRISLVTHSYGANRRGCTGWEEGWEEGLHFSDTLGVHVGFVRLAMQQRVLLHVQVTAQFTVSFHTTDNGQVGRSAEASYR